MKGGFLRRDAWDRGTSLAEVLVAASLLGILVSATYANLISQMRTHATETVVSETMLAARSALGVLSEQIAAAGLGVPRATSPAKAEALITAEAHRLSFWSNFPPRHTYLTAGMAKGSSQLSVQSAAGLTPGAVLYVMDSDNWHFATVVNQSDGAVGIDPPLGLGFAAGSLLMPVEQITFEVSGGKLLRNGRPLIEHVRELSFTYDAEERAAVRMIGVRLTVETRSVDAQRGETVPITVSAEITPPNLAL
jgi:hypothetical protein